MLCDRLLLLLFLFLNIFEQGFNWFFSIIELKNVKFQININVIVNINNDFSHYTLKQTNETLINTELLQFQRNTYNLELIFLLNINHFV